MPLRPRQDPRPAARGSRRSPLPATRRSPAVPIVLIAGAAVAALIAYLLLRGSSAKDDDAPTRKTPSPTQTEKKADPPKTAPPDPEIARRTYRNDKEGFSVVVPVGWEGKEDVGGIQPHYTIRPRDEERVSIAVIIFRAPHRSSDGLFKWKEVLEESRGAIEQRSGPVTILREEKGT